MKERKALTNWTVDLYSWHTFLLNTQDTHTYWAIVNDIYTTYDILTYIYTYTIYDYDKCIILVIGEFCVERKNRISHLYIYITHIRVCTVSRHSI